MKTSQVATGIVAFAMLAAGCGSGPEAVRQSPDALSVTGLGSPHTYDDIPGVRRFSASCALHDPSTNKDYLLVLGGLDAAGAETRDWFLIDPSRTNNQSPSLQLVARGGFGSAREARAFAKAYSLFDVNHHPTACVLVGGLNSAGNPLATFRFEYDSGRGTSMQVINAGAMNTARGAFELLPCGRGRLIAIGGATALSGRPLRPSGTTTSVEIWNGSSKWTTASSVLNTGRFLFGAAKDSGNDRYVVLGGMTADAPSASIESIVVANSCDPTQVTTHHDASVVLPAAVAGNAGLFDAVAGGSVTTFYSAGGEEAGSSSATANVHRIDLNWDTFTSTVIDARTPPSMPDPVAGATIVRTGDLDTSPYLFIGGADKWDYANSATSKNGVSKFTPGSGWAPHATLSNDRVGAVAAYLPSRSKVYVTAGVTVSGGTFGAAPVTTEEIVP